MEYLTNTEELMMKCIWNYGKEMPFLRMGEELKDKFHKEYKRTSIRTYLFRLEDKGYIKVEKRGRKAYINALIYAFLPLFSTLIYPLSSKRNK